MQDAECVIQAHLESDARQVDRTRIDQLTAQVESLLGEKQQTIKSLIESQAQLQAQLLEKCSVPATAAAPTVQTQNSTLVPTADEALASDVPEEPQTPRSRLMRQATTTISALTKVNRAASKYPRVVFSYQSKNVDFMIRLRTFLNDRGIDTVDGAISSSKHEALA